MRYFNYILIAVVAFFLVACGGYKPAPNYSQDIFESPILTKVKIDPEDPDIGVYLQDEIAKMAVNRLNLTLTKNVDAAKGYILVNSYTINTTPVNKDDNGNVIRYSVNAAIEFAIKDKYGFWSKNIVSNEYVSVKAHSLVSAFEKEKASKIAIKKALDIFLLAVIKRSQKIGSNKADVPKNLKKKEVEKGAKTVYIKRDTIKKDLKQDKTTVSPFKKSNDKSYRYEEDSTDELEEPIAYNSYEDSSQEDNEDIGIKIIPVDDENTLVQDATNYN